MSRKKDTEAWIRELRKREAEGITVGTTAAGHWKISLHGRVVAYAAATGGHGRGLQNAKARVATAIKRQRS